MSGQTNIDSFFLSKNRDPTKRYQPVESKGGDAAQVNAEEVAKQNENKEIRPFVYILPCHINQVWSKVSKNLLRIQNRECNLLSIVNLMKENYNSHLTKPRNVNLENLIDFFDELSHSRTEYVQNKLLPFMARLALELPTVFDNQPVLIMQQGDYQEQEFSKHQIGSLLANLFFLATHEQPCHDPEYRLQFECSTFFFRSDNPNYGAQTNGLRKQKIAFLLAYFEAIEKKKVNLDLRVSFERLCPRQRITGKSILDNEGEMIQANIFDEHRIESGSNLFQISFANKRIGGGVLKNGSLQEEIRYLISPECLISVLIFEQLDDEEAILIQGTQQISNYSGYSNTLKCTGLHDSSYLEIQEKNLMLKTVIIGIDAHNFNSSTEEKKEQYSMLMVLRELRKAVAGFSGSLNVVPFSKQGGLPGVITGNWGCGDFGGDKQLKFVIQWLAASISQHKSLNYCTIDDLMQKVELEEIVSVLMPYYIKEVFLFLKDFIMFKKANPESDLSLFVYLLTFVHSKN